MKKFIQNMKEADIRNVIALIVVISGFVVQMMIMIKPIPKENHDLVITSVAYTLGGFTICLGYYFGASKAPKKPEEKIE
jgi:hypothetical protein